MLPHAKLDRCKAIANHELMGELPARAHASPFEKGRVTHRKCVIAHDLLTPNVKLIHEWHAATIGELPLLLRPIDIPAVVVQVAEALLEAGF